MIKIRISQFVTNLLNDFYYANSGSATTRRIGPRTKRLEKNLQFMIERRPGFLVTENCLRLQFF